MADFDLKTIPPKTEGLSDDSIMFGALGGQSDVEPASWSLGVFWDFITPKVSALIPTVGTAAAEDVDFFATAAQGSKADSALQSDDVAPTIHDATSKPTPVDADEFGLVDSASENTLRKLTWENLKAALKAYFDTLYQAIGIGREVLTANRDYFIRDDGSDTNDGLADTPEGAFATIPRAISAVAALDISTFDVSIQLPSGTRNESVAVLSPWIGSGTVTLKGDADHPENYTISTSIGVNCQNGGKLTVSGFTIDSGTSCMNSQNGGFIKIGPGMVFAGAGQLRTNGNASVIDGQNSGGYTLASTVINTHLMASPGGFFNLYGVEIKIPNAIGIYTSFATASRGGVISGLMASVTGAGVASCTGKRFHTEMNGVITTGGQGLEFFPGDVDGTFASGGVYDDIVAPRTLNTKTNNYTLAIADGGGIVRMNVASANDLIVPPNSTVAFLIGTEIDIVQSGAGKTTFVAGSGVTINSPSGALEISVQYGAAKLRKVATDTWELAGNLA